MKIKISNLLLNEDNLRFTRPVTSQLDAILAMVQQEGIHIVNLLEDIIRKGLNPFDGIQVIKHPSSNNKYIVLEGNRRITALKLFSNPDLLEDSSQTNIKKKIAKLKSENETHDLSSVECHICSSVEDHDQWNSLKHGYSIKPGVSTKQWSTLSKEKYQAKNSKRSKGLQVFEWAMRSEFFSDEQKEKLSQIKKTTFNRMIEDPQVRQALGLELEKGIVKAVFEEEEVAKPMNLLIEKMSEPTFTVAQVMTREQRQDFVDDIEKEHFLEKAEELTEPIPLIKPNESANIGANVPPLRIERAPTARKTLVPASSKQKIVISNPRAKRLLDEMSKLDCSVFSNCAAISLRVFLEVSVDSFLEKYKLQEGQSASLTSPGLLSKTNSALKEMIRQKFIDEAYAKPIRVQLASEHSFLSVETMHAYIHNNKINPKHEDLIKAWDELQPIFIALWSKV
jgi:hypothetical protein